MAWAKMLIFYVVILVLFGSVAPMHFCCLWEKSGQKFVWFQPDFQTPVRGPSKEFCCVTLRLEPESMQEVDLSSVCLSSASY